MPGWLTTCPEGAILVVVNHPARWSEPYGGPMCKQTPVTCPDCQTPLTWADMGTAVCDSGDHAIWVPALPTPSGHRCNTLKGAVVFQEECPNCTWPAIDYRLLPDLHGKPGPLTGTTWWTARHLQPGMRVRIGFSHALTITRVTALPGHGGQPDRTRLAVAPPPRQGEPLNVITFADSPMCVEDGTP